MKPIFYLLIGIHVLFASQFLIAKGEAKESFEGAKLSFNIGSKPSEITIYNNSSVKINGNQKLLLKTHEMSSQQLTMSLHVLPEMINSVDQLFVEYPVAKQVVISCQPSNELVDFQITDLSLKGAVCQQNRLNSQ